MNSDGVKEVHFHERQPTPPKVRKIDPPTLQPTHCSVRDTVKDRWVKLKPTNSTPIQQGGKTCFACENVVDKVLPLNMEWKGPDDDDERFGITVCQGVKELCYPCVVANTDTFKCSECSRLALAERKLYYACGPDNVRVEHRQIEQVPHSSCCLAAREVLSGPKKCARCLKWRCEMGKTECQKCEKIHFTTACRNCSTRYKYLPRDMFMAMGQATLVCPCDFSEQHGSQGTSAKVCKFKNCANKATLGKSMCVRCWKGKKD